MNRRNRQIDVELELTSDAEFQTMLAQRRDLFSKHAQTNEIVYGLWLFLALLGYVDESTMILKENGYIKMMLRLKRALENEHLFEENDGWEECQETYERDNERFGPFSCGAFFDMMYDIMDAWVEAEKEAFCSAFAYTLFTSVVDLDKKPPTFRKLGHVKTVATLDNDVHILNKYFTSATPDAKKRTMRRVRGEVEPEEPIHEDGGGAGSAPLFPTAGIPGSAGDMAVGGMGAMIAESMSGVQSREKSRRSAKKLDKGTADVIANVSLVMNHPAILGYYICDDCCMSPAAKAGVYLDLFGF